MAVIICAGMIFIGLRFVLAPAVGAEGYGVRLNEDFIYGRIKGFRDLTLGLALIPFLWKREKRTCGILVAIYCIMPVTDAWIVWQQAAPSWHAWMHTGMGVFMLATAFLLFKPSSHSI